MRRESNSLPRPWKLRESNPLRQRLQGAPATLAVAPVSGTYRDRTDDLVHAMHVLSLAELRSHPAQAVPVEQAQARPPADPEQMLTTVEFPSYGSVRPSCAAWEPAGDVRIGRTPRGFGGRRSATELIPYVLLSLPPHRPGVKAVRNLMAVT